LTLATAAVGMFRVGQHALSVDESISLRVARQPLFAAGRIVAETDAALLSPYELLLRVWQFGGTSETFLRSLSVTLGVGTVLVLFALNVRLFDRRTAVASCTLLIVNLSFIRQMQEVTAYALVLFLAVTASWCFALALTRPSSSRWITYAVISAAAMWSYVASGFVVFAHAISLLLRRPRPSLGRIGASCLLAGALVTLLVFLMRGTERFGGPLASPPSEPAFERLLLYLMVGGGMPGSSTYLLLLMYFAICCAGFMMVARAENRHRHSAGSWANSLILLWIGIPVVAAFCMSIARPTIDPRSLIVVLPAVVTIAGIGISSLPHRTLRGLAIAIVVALSSGPIFSYYRIPIGDGGDGRIVAASVAQHALRQP
jgi:mannosyltransferase